MIVDHHPLEFALTLHDYLTKPHKLRSRYWALTIMPGDDREIPAHVLNRVLQRFFGHPDNAHEPDSSGYYGEAAYQYARTFVCPAEPIAASA